MSGPGLALIGCGYTLQRVARCFDPQEILLVVRNPELHKAMLEYYPFVECVSVEDFASLSMMFKKYPGLSTVVDSVPPGLSREEIEQKKIKNGLNGVQHIAACVANSNVKRLIYLSTSGVYGVTNGKIVTELTPPRPNNIKSYARLRSEETYRKLECKVSVLRISAIYGPGRGIGTALKSGRFRQIADGMQWSNRIQIQDLVEAIYQTIQCEDPPVVLNVCDSEPSFQKEVINFYCDQFSIEKPMITTRDELKAAGSFTRLSSQRIQNYRLLQLVKQLDYPSFRDGAVSEFD